jgi:DNA-directed RNA polymerase subunit RPC12/RpoP
MYVMILSHLYIGLLLFCSDYVADFQESIPIRYVSGEPESFFIVERLRLTYGGDFPIGPWTRDEALSRGPLVIDGTAIGLESHPYSSITESMEYVKELDACTQIWYKKEIQRISDLWPHLRPIYYHMLVDEDYYRAKDSKAPSQSEAEVRNNHLSTLARARQRKRHLVSKDKCEAKTTEAISTMTTKEKMPHVPSDIKTKFQKLDGIFYCALCKYQSKDRSNLNKHLRIHSVKQSYICATCGKMFSDPSNMKMHEKRHKEKMSYACKECGQKFAAANNLHDHIERHKSVKSLVEGKCLFRECKEIGKEFKDLMQHLKKCHKVQSMEKYIGKIKENYNLFEESGTEYICRDCPEHNVWIYKWTGTSHACCLCTCSYCYYYRWKDGKKEFTRFCKFARIIPKYSEWIKCC